MQTVNNLREAVLAAGGTLDIGKNIVMTYSVSDDGESDLDIKHDGILIAYISSLKDGKSKLINSLSVFDCLKHYEAIGILGAYLGILTNEIAQDTPSSVGEPVEDPEKHRLGGMVEAYEKLLIGRGVNITS
jgi:hypothetical protein